MRSQANAARRSFSQRTHNDNVLTHGTRHIPVFLVQFKDLSFTVENPAEAFAALLNERGYSADGGTGSVQDFYYDNSKGHFTPVFDVFGPVTLSRNMAYYDSRAGEALIEAAKQLDESVDFSIYDADNDGYVDMSLFYYAGYNEAEGGPTDSIWPHQGYVSSEDTLDGLHLGTYFCTSELKGSEGSNMCGIGTTCHEFGHSLGLPDFYDTDYEANGQCTALSAFSTMCSGSYNNKGRTPPYFNAEERLCLGWMMDDDIPEIPEGELSFGSVKDDIAYRSASSAEGEYFLYECRDGSGWDAYIPKGLLVYHVDKSPLHYVGGLTARQQWTDWQYHNTINAYGSHPCFYVVPAASQKSLNYSGSLSDFVFPGNHRVTTYSPVDWSGEETGLSLSGIAYSQGDATVSFSAVYSTEKIIKGYVSSQDGRPVSGVYIVLSETSSTSKAPRLRSISRRSTQLQALTDDDGFFSISLEGLELSRVHLSLTKEGYEPLGTDVELRSRITTVRLSLVRTGETGKKDFSYSDPEGQKYYGGGEGKGNSQMAAIRIGAEELAAGGGKIVSVSLLPYTAAQAYYIIVDAGSERLLTYQIPGERGGRYEYLTVDLSEMDVIFPGETDIYVGYAVRNASPDYDGMPMILASGPGAHTWYADYNLQSSNWDETEEEGYNLLFTASIIGYTDGSEGGGGEEVPVTSFAQMGIPAISDPGCGNYALGDVFLLEMELPEDVQASVSWKFDGLNVSDPVTLSAGQHRVTATLSYPDGSEETLELMIFVK